MNAYSTTHFPYNLYMYVYVYVKVWHKSIKNPENVEKKLQQRWQFIGWTIGKKQHKCEIKCRKWQQYTLNSVSAYSFISHQRNIVIGMASWCWSHCSLYEHTAVIQTDPACQSNVCVCVRQYVFNHVNRFVELTHTYGVWIFIYFPWLLSSFSLHLSLCVNVCEWNEEQQQQQAHSEIVWGIYW